MKKSILFIATIVIAQSLVFAQEFEKPSEGKSLVYFVRSSGTGALINFKYFDGEKYLGKLQGVNYFKYECDPGEHIFWAAAENRDFIKGELLPNSTYIIEVKPTMGAMKARVKLLPVAPDNAKVIGKVKKIMSKKSEAALSGQDDDVDFLIENGMKKYSTVESTVKIIDSNWTF